MAKQFLVTIAILALTSSLVNASDPGPLQDYCVAIDDPKDALFVNGKFCKNPDLVNADDFSYSGFNKPGNTSNPLGSFANLVNVLQWKGLNTMGLSMARIDFAPYGVNPPHSHPRAAEVFIVMEGTLLVGFVTSNIQGQEYRLFIKTLYPGDTFVFPPGLIHFQENIGKTNAVAFASFNSQNPGVVRIANAVFGSDPRIPQDVLMKAFQVDKKVIDYLQSQFWMVNN